ncbi:unnamed protein product [Penicillium roqueforti FM164]|uniref:Genomic scaffold, ProqFM164S01 n=1 Tax=Penicillium roqueforti (strain FM164) TaxID=1365484 RepID=W6PY03_PENRF|nr:unnamed protein product [Penicillium roqueforti FM164]
MMIVPADVCRHSHPPCLGRQGAFLPHLPPDDAPFFHSGTAQHLYSSPRYGDLEIMVPTYPGQA